MKNMMANATATAVLYRMAIIRCVLFVLGTLVGATLAALSGMDWASSDGQTRFMVCLGIGGTVCTTIGAFLDTAMKQAREGKDPLTGASLSLPPFASQAQVDAGLSTQTMVSPATLANMPAVKAADEQLPKP